MSSLRAPAVLAQGQWWPAASIDLIARRLYRDATRQLPPGADLVALVVPRSVHGIAAVLAATALPAHVILLAPDPRAWRSDPPIPPGTPFLLTADVAYLAPHVERAGGRAVPIADDGVTATGGVEFLQTRGMIWLTSGSTGLPRPVFRTRAAIRACVERRLATLPLAEGAGVISGDSLAHGQGFVEFLLACRTGGPFAPLDPLAVRSTLATLAMPEFAIWFTTAQMADMLGRCPIDREPAAPPLCFVAGGVSRRTAAAFSARFGRVLRQHYGSSEGGPIAIDHAPEGAIRPDTVGQAAHGVAICIGDDPRAPRPTGGVGRIWVRSDAQFTGYGYPPRVSAEAIVDGWTPTCDLGALDEHGYLSLVGRMDDCIRVRDGRLVNLALVASRLREADGVGDAVALPMVGDSGTTFGAIVEGTPALDLVRRHLDGELPPWCRPRTLVAVAALPRLPNGKIDRAACTELLRSVPA